MYAHHATQKNFTRLAAQRINVSEVRVAVAVDVLKGLSLKACSELRA